MHLRSQAKRDKEAENGAVDNGGQGDAESGTLDETQVGQPKEGGEAAHADHTSQTSEPDAPLTLELVRKGLLQSGAEPRLVQWLMDRQQAGGGTADAGSITAGPPPETATTSPAPNANTESIVEVEGAKGDTTVTGTSATAMSSGPQEDPATATRDAPVQESATASANTPSASRGESTVSAAGGDVVNITTPQERVRAAVGARPPATSTAARQLAIDPEEHHQAAAKGEGHAHGGGMSEADLHLLESLTDEARDAVLRATPVVRQQLLQQHMTLLRQGRASHRGSTRTDSREEATRPAPAHWRHAFQHRAALAARVRQEQESVAQQEDEESPPPTPPVKESDVIAATASRTDEEQQQYLLEVASRERRSLQAIARGTARAPTATDSVVALALRSNKRMLETAIATRDVLVAQAEAAINDPHVEEDYAHHLRDRLAATDEDVSRLVEQITRLVPASSRGPAHHQEPHQYQARVRAPYPVVAAPFTGVQDNGMTVDVEDTLRFLEDVQETCDVNQHTTIADRINTMVRALRGRARTWWSEYVRTADPKITKSWDAVRHAVLHEFGGAGSKERLRSIWENIRWETETESVTMYHQRLKVAGRHTSVAPDSSEFHTRFWAGIPDDWRTMLAFQGHPPSSSVASTLRFLLSLESEAQRRGQSLAETYAQMLGNSTRRKSNKILTGLMHEGAGAGAGAYAAAPLHYEGHHPGPPAQWGNYYDGDGTTATGAHYYMTPAVPGGGSAPRPPPYHPSFPQAAERGEESLSTSLWWVGPTPQQAPEATVFAIRELEDRVLAHADTRAELVYAMLPIGRDRSRIQDVNMVRAGGTPPVCYQCNGKGHIARYCPNPDAACYFCGASGHRSNVCPVAKQRGYTAVCDYCHNKGHIEAGCLRKKRGRPPVPGPKTGLDPLDKARGVVSQRLTAAVMHNGDNVNLTPAQVRRCLFDGAATLGVEDRQRLLAQIVASFEQDVAPRPPGEVSAPGAAPSGLSGGGGHGLHGPRAPPRGSQDFRKGL